jgi:hypothetical protein
MNTTAYYNGFVSRCMEHGLTKQAADALYKEAGLLDDLKSGGGQLLDGMKTVGKSVLDKSQGLANDTWQAIKRMPPEQRNALLGTLFGGTGGLAAAIATGQGLSKGTAMTLWSAGLSGLGAYEGTRFGNYLAKRFGNPRQTYT